MKVLLLMSFLYLTSGAPEARESGQIVVNVTELKLRKGEVHIALYDSEEHFMNTDKMLVGKVVSVSPSGPVSVELGVFPYGDYAIALFQDLNKNGKLDTNLLGVPVEPYAFSNNTKVKWGPATFEEARFSLQQERLELDIQPKRWKDH